MTSAWRLGDHDVRRIGLIDDEPGSRQSLGWVVNDASLEPVPYEGPLPSIDECLTMIASSSDALVCDHHLRVTNYADFNGAELVARNIGLGHLSILCTRYTGTDIELIRPFLPQIPVLVRPDELNEPDELLAALTECALELSGEIAPERKTWRTQVVVERIELDESTVDFSVPAWTIEETVRYRKADLPGDLFARLAVGFRCYARVNLGAESPERLFVHRWEF
jgi:hypothetical protein